MILPSQSKIPHWVFLLLFVLLVALPFLGRLWLHATADEEALVTLAEMGAELPDRPLRDVELDLPLALHNGQTTTLRALLANGDLLILHFWASWCKPCLQELPEIAHLAQVLQGRRVQVVSLSHDDDWADADAALQQTLGVAQPKTGVWLKEREGQSGEPQRMLRVHLGTEQLPETYILGPNGHEGQGQVLARLIAGQPWGNPRLLRALERLIPRT